MVRLESLAINNFRGIREGRIEGFADVNVLVGRNNSGKTSVIEAITRVAAGGGFQRDVFGRDVDAVWRQARFAAVSPQSSQFTGQHGQPHAEQSLLFYRRNAAEGFKISAIVRDGASAKERLIEVACLDAGASITGGRPPAGNDALDLEAVRPFCSGFTVFRPADAFNAAIEQQFWPALLSDRRDRILTKALNDIFNLEAESFQLLPNNQFTVLFHDFSLPLDVQGDGTRAAMRTLMTVCMLKNTLLMVEEPECHQHPGSLERFAGALCRLAKAQSVQMMVSTHSGECVRAFMRAAEGAQSIAAVFHLSLDNGKQEARRLDPEAVETLTDTGIDIRFADLYA